jgi:cobaltochelatase CobN
VFAPAPGAYSPSIQFLAKSGDQRGDERKMAELYTSRLSHAYGEGLYGEQARPAFERQLARLDGAAFARSDVVNGLLDNPMPAGFLGGLNLAAKAVTGRDIDLYVSNLRDEARPAIESAATEIQRELRTRYFNKSWVAEMQGHGYEGARTFMYLTDHLDLWNTTAARTVSAEDWREIKRVYVDDELGLDMDRFFDRHNPHAQQVLLGNLLGAATRGHWQPTGAERVQLAARLARSAAAHGIACEASLCRNPALTRLLSDTLSGTDEGRTLAAEYRAAVAAATTPPATSRPDDRPATSAGTTANRAGRGAPGPGRAATTATAPAVRPAAAAAPLVTGRVLETVARVPARPDAEGRPDVRWLVLGLAAAACLLAGWVREGATRDVRPQRR